MEEGPDRLFYSKPGLSGCVAELEGLPAPLSSQAFATDLKEECDRVWNHRVEKALDSVSRSQGSIEDENAQDPKAKFSEQRFAPETKGQGMRDREETEV